MAKRRTLCTVAEAVKAFGGPAKMAKWCNVRPSAVSNWIERAYIPPGWHYRMAAELAARGFDVDPVVFGEKPGLVGNPYRTRRVA